MGPTFSERARRSRASFSAGARTCGAYRHVAMAVIIPIETPPMINASSGCIGKTPQALAADLGLPAADQPADVLPVADPDEDGEDRAHLGELQVDRGAARRRAATSAVDRGSGEANEEAIRKRDGAARRARSRRPPGRPARRCAREDAEGGGDALAAAELEPDRVVVAEHRAEGRHEGGVGPVEAGQQHRGGALCRRRAAGWRR